MLRCQSEIKRASKSHKYAKSSIDVEISIYPRLVLLGDILYSALSKDDCFAHFLGVE